MNFAVDRTLCSEFQLLSELCDVLLAAVSASSASGAVGSAAARGSLRGHAFLFVSAAPCLSCVCAVRQFQLIFPQVSLAVSCRSRVVCAEVTD